MRLLEGGTPRFSPRHPPFQTVSSWAGEDGIAALQVRLDVAVSQVREQRAKVCHGDAFVAAHVDTAK